MRLSNSTIVIVLATIIATSTTAAFVDAEVNIQPDGTMSSDSPFPAHWGQPPMGQTRDYVVLPGSYGRGSSTLKHWIEEKMAEDAAAAADTADAGTERRFADPSSSSSPSWPEKSLIGMTGEEATQEINIADPTLEVQILDEDAMMTMDYREDRVRIFVNADGKVVNQPHKG
uniref:Subtilisin inhibitor domain-containing protein n=1 Tax=Skeletonema marinoi TaxID=267567 RepID=A0A7S2KDV1_9STRA|mmetsp:Transcript_12004/g.20359  ORF Transcript_12004/g.20359 Transcript_12004/m.20359 type:complete len:172 (+) Transcript_12004:33-548(+)